ncbi:hypothetical protein AVEN_110962-1 [Araneus ventricosus]|uniref:Uncharacterized protein n=1 Tax=Araneus ventricosus TaxID=182803 RepID=A0A4Y2ULM5_ARAVE|nr:hypothetical protein AVEN_110962-1 [Araneus ventricosus]
MDESANVSELAKKMTVADAVEWSKSAWRDLDSGLVVKCFATCGMTNSAIEKQIFSFNETKTVYEIAELSKIAGIEYDQKVLECEDNLECFHDLSDNGVNSWSRESYKILSGFFNGLYKLNYN